MTPETPLLTPQNYLVVIEGMKLLIYVPLFMYMAKYPVFFFSNLHVSERKKEGNSFEEKKFHFVVPKQSWTEPQAVQVHIRNKTNERRRQEEKRVRQRTHLAGLARPARLVAETENPGLWVQTGRVAVDISRVG